MQKYFFPTPKNQEEAKAMYRALAHIHHPDKGGRTETMQAINAEYADLLADLTHTAERRRQAAAHDEGRKTNADFVDLDQVENILRAKIEELLNLDADIEIELIGLWIWVTGNTRAIKDQLKTLGLHWRHQKQAWTFEAVPSRNRNPWELDRIRDYYGSQRIQKPQRDEPESLPA